MVFFNIIIYSYTKQNSLTKTITLQSIGMSVLEFLNTAIAEFILYVVVYDEFHYGRIFGPSGLIYNINNLFITNAIIPVLILILDPVFLIFRYIKNKEKKR